MSTRHVTKQLAPIHVYDFTMPLTEHTSVEKVKAYLRSIAKKWCFQLEQGNTGYNHYQGRFSLKVKQRIEPLGSGFRDMQLTCHLSPTATENHKNMFYVMKADTRVDGPWQDTDIDEMAIAANIPSHLHIGDVENSIGPSWYQWQEKANKWLLKYEKRWIRVLWDPMTCHGKSDWAMYWMARKKLVRIPPQESARDIARSILCRPECSAYVIDIPKAEANKHLHSMFAAIEELKNGYCYDDRYEFKERIQEIPVVIVILNALPPKNMLGRNRWKIFTINYNHEMVHLQHFPEEKDLETIKIVEPSGEVYEFKGIPPVHSKPMPRLDHHKYVALKVVPPGWKELNGISPDPLPTGFVTQEPSMLEAMLQASNTTGGT